MSGMTPEKIEQQFQDLDFTQNVRRRIVNGIADKAIENSDPEMLRTTMQALDGMDKSALGQLKINEKAKENETRANESEAMAKYLITLQERRQRGEDAPVGSNTEPAPRALPAALRPEYDPSIRDASAGIETNAEFTARMEGTT